MAARVVGIRQEGVNPCRMVPSMRDEARAAAMTSRARSNVRESRVAALELRDLKKKKKNWRTKASPAFR